MNGFTRDARRTHRGWLGMALLCVAAGSILGPAWGVLAGPPEDATAAPDRSADAAGHLPTTAQEARVRAQLLHEMIHGALQVMHRDLFDEDEGLTLPSQSLEDVFVEMERRWQVQIRWLAVNAKAMNTDHRPKDAFEEQAVTTLAAGENEFEASEGNVYRYAGAIRLSSTCLKCHVPNRTSLEDRAAGLVIAMPLRK